MGKSFKNFFLDLKDLFFSLNLLIDTKNIKPNIVFFSEGKDYQKFSKPLIDTILLSTSAKIIYFSLDKNDKILNRRVSNYYVHPFLINFIFNRLQAQNLFLTVTDLGNNILKKNKHIDKYIYYFHSPVSTTKNYTSTAFDNYEIILCVGQFQIDEIRLREKSKKSK